MQTNKKKFIKLILIICFLIIPFQISAEENIKKFEILTQKAFKKELFNKRYWHILLHYKKTSKGYESVIDDPDFFLSKTGKTNPKDELRENIKLFFGENTTSSTEICRFYARYRWLKQELDPENKTSELYICKDIKNIKPGIVSLVFPTYYLNNPASMFGHTLLVINTKYKNKRLSDSINYAAHTDTQNGVNFAIRGIFGFFKGYYSVMPYYKKINQYLGINQRDIWEYKLNLEPDEVEKMIWHIRELDNIYSDYYFFNENCSYNILFLLEAARPSLKLTNQFNFPVIPVDTIKLLKKEKIIESVNFRPSGITKIKNKMYKLNENEKKLSVQLSNGKLNLTAFKNITPDKKVKILDLSIEILRYKFSDKKISQQEYKKRFLYLLKIRSSFKSAKNKKESFLKIKEPRPDLSHSSSKISSGISFSNGTFYNELRYRPAFTDLTDTDFVTRKGAKIEFLDTRIFYNTKTKDLYLKQLELIDIVSISPRDEVFKPLSWKINTGFTNIKFKNNKNSSIYHINTGGGFAYELNDSLLAYMMVEQDFEVGGVLDKNYSAGFGFSSGIIGNATKNSRFHSFIKGIKYGLGENDNLYESGITYNIKLSKNNHITFEYKQLKKQDLFSSDLSLYWNLFF